MDIILNTVTHDVCLDKYKRTLLSIGNSVGRYRFFPLQIDMIQSKTIRSDIFCLHNNILSISIQLHYCCMPNRYM